MDWEIRLPIGNREDPISNLGCDAGYLDNEDDVAVARQLFWDAVKGGRETTGDYVDHLESLPEADRRAVLDKARVGAALEPTAVIEQRRSDFLFEAEFNRLQPPDPPRWGPMQSCPHCNAYPIDETGKWIATDLERWHCPQHRHWPRRPISQRMRRRTSASTTTARRSRPRSSGSGSRLRTASDGRKKSAYDGNVREHARREYEVIAEAKQRYIDEGEISIMGVRTRHDGRIIDRMNDYSVAVHEASHCAAGWLLGREVDHTWVATGNVQPGETAGHASIPIKDKIEFSQLVIALIGYMSTNTPNWPPSFSDARTEELEGLSIIMLALNADEERYRKTVQFCRELLEDPDFIRLRDAIARALSRVPRGRRRDDPEAGRDPLRFRT